MTTSNSEEIIDKYEGAEAFANDYTFHRWCEDLFILNNEIQTQTTLDTYYIRAYFIVIYELSNEGLHYAKKQEDCIPDKRYSLLVKMIEEMFSKINDDEYFLIKYLRDSNCHIFTHSYNYRNENGGERNGTNFYRKDGTKYYLRPKEIMKKAESILGNTIGGDLKFKENIINTFYPIIKNYEPLYYAEKEKITSPTNNLYTLLNINNVL